MKSSLVDPSCDVVDDDVSGNRDVLYDIVDGSR